MQAASIVDEALAAWWETHPVDASFAGDVRYDDRLPAADADAPRRERERRSQLLVRLDAHVSDDDLGARLDVRMLRATLRHENTDAYERARYRNPAWYTGEAAFAIVSLLLPGPVPHDVAALRARIAELPAFFDDAIAHLRGRPIPAPWIERARAETMALDEFLTVGIPLHPWAARLDDAPIAAVRAALMRFRVALVAVDDDDPRCGPEHLEFIMQTVHGLGESPAQLEARAQHAYDLALEELVAYAHAVDPHRSWREQIAALAEIGPANNDAALASYRTWDERARRDAAHLVTPASDYILTYAPLPAWAQSIAAALYFLFYRSPAARHPGSGSTYWVGSLDLAPDELRRAHNVAAVKMIHAVHHGSIGHHTQNARARTAPSRVARIAGTDGPSAIAMLGAGSLAEGWACYAEDLMAEVPDFFTPVEHVQRAYFTFRNIACCLADVRLHARIWTLAEMRCFYVDDVGFAPGRVVSETTRNTMFPGSRLMYWTGTEQIAALRKRSLRSARDFHDTLLGFGALPVAWIGEEMNR